MMEHYPYSMLVYDNTTHVSGIHMDFYINFCIFHEPEEITDIETVSERTEKSHVS